MKIFNRKERSTKYFRRMALESVAAIILFSLLILSRSPYDWMSMIWTAALVCAVINLMSEWPRIFKDYRGPKDY